MMTVTEQKALHDYVLSAQANEQARNALDRARVSLFLMIATVLATAFVIGAAIWGTA